MESQSFEQFVRGRGPALLRFATVLAGDRGTGEDVLQEVLTRAMRRWPHIRALDSPGGYVRRMIVNEYLSWRRKWARLIPSALVLDDRETPDHADRHAERDALSHRLDALPPKQRAVLVLRYYEDLPDREIAAVLGCPVGTVRSHASRGLAALRIEAEPHQSPATMARRKDG